MTLKRKILAGVCVFIALLVCGIVYVDWPFRTIRLLHGRYEQVQRGMSIQEVQRVMDHSPVQTSEHWYPAWDDEQLDPTEAARIVSAFRYSVKTFYLPVSFEFTFDSDQRLVGKHIYD